MWNHGNFWLDSMTNTVAVTGCRGYIGAILCRMLKQQGYAVSGFDNKRGEAQPDVDFYTNDWTDFRMEIFRKRINKVFHLAAKANPVEESYTKPLRYFHNNVGFTASILNDLSDWGWKGDVVFASSAAVYAECPDPLTEAYPTFPSSNYGLSKLMCEQILQAATVQGIRSVALRFFNVAGSYEGLVDNNPHVLVKLCAAARLNVPFKIFGDSFATPDGTCVRDYIHVADVCNAMIVAMRRFELERSVGVERFEQFRAFNLGNSRGVSMLELVNTFSQVSGCNVPISFCAPRKGDAPILVADNTKFNREYTFVPRLTLETMIESEWNSHILKGISNAI